MAKRAWAIFSLASSDGCLHLILVASGAVRGPAGRCGRPAGSSDLGRPRWPGRRPPRARAAPRDRRAWFSSDQSMSDGIRRFLAESLLNKGAVRAEKLSHLVQGEGQLELFQIRVDRPRGHQALFELRQRRLGVLPVPLFVGFCPLLEHPAPAFWRSRTGSC